MAEFVPPHDESIEQRLLASIISSKYGANLVSQIAEDDFYLPAHREIFNVLQTMTDNGEVPDAALVADAVERLGNPTLKGRALGYVLDVMESGFVSQSADGYIETVRRHSISRALLGLGNELRDMSTANRHDAETIIQHAEDAIFAQRDRRVGGEGYVGAEGLMTSALNEMSSDKPPGITTGYHDLDKLMGPMVPGNIIVVAGRPGMGKTGLAISIGMQNAKAGKSVGVVSLEMTRDEVATRIISAQAGVDNAKITRHEMNADEWARVSRHTDIISKDWRFSVDDSTAQTGVGSIRSNAQRLKARTGLDLLIVDYIGLLGNSTEHRVAEVSNISRQLKVLARDLGVPIIVVSQLNRGPESRPNKRPLLSDLRETGAIEQDADVVAMLYRDDYYDEDSEVKGQVEVNIAKNRNGGTGTVTLGFMPTFTLFVDLKEVENLQRAGV